MKLYSYGKSNLSKQVKYGIIDIISKWIIYILEGIKMKERKLKRTRWLWLMLFISYMFDKWHCNYLSWIYQCEVAEVLTKVPFYWLSVCFGVVDLILGVAIMRRAITKQQIQPTRWKLFSMKYSTEYSKNKASISVEPWELEKLVSAFIIFISGSSLAIDVVKFLF